MKLGIPLLIVAALAAFAWIGTAYLHWYTLFGIVIPYAAFVLFVVGFAVRIIKWGTSAVPFRIPTTCGQQKSLPWIKQNKLENPSSFGGVVGRMLLEVLCFRSLFRNAKTDKVDDKLAFGSAKWLWLGALVFHWSMLIIVLRRSPSVPPYQAPSWNVRTMQPSWKFLAGIFCALAASAILPGSAEAGGFISWWSIIGGNAVAAVLILLLLASKRQGDFQKALMVFVGIMAVCYALSGLFIGADSGTTSTPFKVAQHCVILATQPCVSIAMWFVLLDIAQKTRVSPFLICGLGLIAGALGRAAGTGIGMAAPLDPAALSILALLMLVPSMYFFATSDQPKEVIVNAEEVLQRRLDRMADTAGLTAREREILELWVTGHRLDYVAEALFISKNTVKTHLRHIYQKTQTGNKEELLVLFEQQA